MLEAFPAPIAVLLMARLLPHTQTNYGMEKEKELKPMTIELPQCVLPATQNSIKAQISAKQREWLGGKKRTEKRLPCYLNQGFYIPSFDEMTQDAVELLNSLNVDSQPTPAAIRKPLLGNTRS